jgi:hypothetical protein
MKHYEEKKEHGKEHHEHEHMKEHLRHKELYKMEEKHHMGSLRVRGNASKSHD